MVGTVLRRGRGPRRGTARRVVALALAAVVAALPVIGVPGTSTAAAPREGLALDPFFREAFGTGFDDIVETVNRATDGGFLVGGRFTSVNGDSSIPDGLVKFREDGSLDEDFNARLGTGFGSGVQGGIRAVATGTHDGVSYYYVGGYFSSVQGTRVSGLARLNLDGSLDEDFVAAMGSGAGGQGEVGAIIQLSDGDMLVGGWFSSFSGRAAGGLSRIDAHGAIDDDFVSPLGSGFSEGTVTSLVEAPDGRILVGGAFGTVSGTRRGGLSWILPDGGYDEQAMATWGSGFRGTVSDVALDSRGRILVAGNMSQFNTAPVNRLVRFTADGTGLDQDFATVVGAIDGSVRTMTLDASNGMLLGGDFTTVKGTAVGKLARISATGSLDMTFNQELGTGFGGTGIYTAQEWDGGVMVGGDFSQLNGGDVPHHVFRLTTVSVQVHDLPNRSDAEGTTVDLAVPISIVPTNAADLSATGLPDGLVYDPETGRITGTPTTPGTYSVAITAECLPIGPRSSESFTWTILPAPSLVGVPGDGVVGESYEFVFGVGGDPAPEVGVVDSGLLPPGLSVSGDGVLSGVPTSAGVFEFVVVAGNGVGEDVRLPVSVTVLEAEPVAEDPWLEVQHTERLAGQEQVARGGGFVPGEDVSFSMSSEPTELGSVVADAGGEVELVFQVPGATTAGPHTLTATGDSGESSTTFTVLADEPGFPSGSGSGTGQVLADGGELAWTGLALGGALAVAAGLIAAGLLLVGRARRRT